MFISQTETTSSQDEHSMSSDFQSEGIENSHKRTDLMAHNYNVGKIIVDLEMESDGSQKMTKFWVFR